MLERDPWDPEPERVEVVEVRGLTPRLPRTKGDGQGQGIKETEKDKPERTFKVEIPRPETRGNPTGQGDPVGQFATYDVARLEC